MISVLAVALLAQSTPVSSVKSTELIGTVQIPDEIAPAVIPYVICLSDRSNAAIKTIAARDKVGGLDGSRTREATAIAFADCKAKREEAATGARKALDTLGTGTAVTRAKTIEDTLVGIETPYTSNADKLDAFNKAPTAPGK